MFVDAGLPVTALPGVIVEFRRIPKLFFVNIGAETVKRRIISKPAPGDRVMIVSEADKATETQHGIDDAARNLVNHQVVDLTDPGSLTVINLGAFHVFAGN